MRTHLAPTFLLIVQQNKKCIMTKFRNGVGIANFEGTGRGVQAWLNYDDDY